MNPTVATAQALTPYIADEDTRTLVAFDIVTAVVVGKASRGDVWVQLLGSDLPTSQRGELVHNLRTHPLIGGLVPTTYEIAVKAAARAVATMDA